VVFPDEDADEVDGVVFDGLAVDCYRLGLVVACLLII